MEICQSQINVINKNLYSKCSFYNTNHARFTSLTLFRDGKVVLEFYLLKDRIFESHKKRTQMFFKQI